MPKIVRHRDDNRASFAQPRGKDTDLPALLVSLHDVTPAHAPRLARAEHLLSALGVTDVAYLYVPDYHGRAAAHHDPAFAAWCRAPRTYRIQWFLHGYYHVERGADRRGAPPQAPGEWFARRFLTNHEAEFLSLRGRGLRERLEAGLQSIMRTTDEAPDGFIAPAWLYNEELMPLLQRLGIRFTESHFHIFDLQTRETVAAPVITWASRTALHRVGARCVAAVESRLWERKRVIRVALHPADFEHPAIVDSIARTLEQLLATHRVVTYGLCGALE